MAKGDENGEERFREDLLDVVCKQCLECARAFREDGSCRVCGFQIVCNGVCIGEDLRGCW